MSENTKVRGYKIDFAKNTFTMNYKFAKASQECDSKEYMIFKEILNDFPNMKVIIKSGREQTKPRYNKRLTYANMERYIMTFDNAFELMEQFKTVRAKSALIASPYKYVCDWFKAQFPEYKEIPSFDKKPISKAIVPAPEERGYAKKAA